MEAMSPAMVDAIVSGHCKPGNIVIITGVTADRMDLKRNWLLLVPTIQSYPSKAPCMHAANYFNIFAIRKLEATHMFYS